MKHVPSDTSSEAADRLRRLLADRTGEQRLRMACEMFDSARRLALASLPESVQRDRAEWRISLLRRFYQRDLAPAALEEIITRLKRYPPATGSAPGSTLRLLNGHERAQMRQWLANWKLTGPLLEGERAARVQALSDAQGAGMALDLWQFARPDAGDNGEGLLLVTRRLQKLENP